jgi:hypothetical protein
MQMRVTMIDPATGWFEIQQYDDKQSITVANVVEQEWFSRYPWPTQITFDRGSEFIGHDFQTMIKKDYAIKGLSKGLSFPPLWKNVVFFVGSLILSQ